MHERYNLGTNLGQALTGKFRVEVFSRPVELILGKGHAGPNYLVMHNIRRRNQYNQNPVIGKVDKLDMLQAITRQTRRYHDANIIRKSREQVRGTFHQPVRSFLFIKAVFLAYAVKIVIRYTQDAKQVVNVKPVTAVGRNASGGGVRLLEHSHLLQFTHHVADRRRTHTTEVGKLVCKHF